MDKTIAVCVGLCLCAVWTTGKLNGGNPRYTNIWGAKIEGGEEVAQRVARDLGFTYRGKLGQFKDYYELVREDHPEVCLRHSEHLTTRLLELDEVKWANQQRLVRPVTHDLYKYTEESVQDGILSYIKTAQLKQRRSPYGECKPVFSCISLPTSYKTYLRSKGQEDTMFLGTFSTKPAPKKQLDTYSWTTTKPVNLVSKKLSAYVLDYNDPYWTKQWYLQDYRTTDMPVMDLNVVPVHKMGYTGKNVVVGVIDNGVEHNHPDLIGNFIEDLSYDTCNNQPGSWPVGNSHGTRCAGVIAMVPNNGFCGVGIAYDAKIVGLRAICDDEQAEYATAKALMMHQDKIHIYSNSWGYIGQGQHLFRISHLEKEAYRLGATEGRHKKGIIFVRSSGNDKDEGDNCGVDPDINIIYSITIAGAGQTGAPAYYSERCTAIFATTYTKSDIFTEGIIAPDINEGCSTTFGGTSAACPLMSGIIALVLDANKHLTYRDVMHIITMSAEVAPLANNENTWYQNGRGFWVSNDFGFGLANAENMVNYALNWETVPELRNCVVDLTLEKPAYLSHYHGVDISFKTRACQFQNGEVNYLEHVELASIVEYGYRGDLTVYLQSPAGTISQLLETRYKDDDKDGLEGWGIISTHNWGENPRGMWTVRYRAKKRWYYESQPNTKGKDESLHGYVKSFTLTFYGTKEMPAHYMERRPYAAFRLPDGQTGY